MALRKKAPAKKPLDKEFFAQIGQKGGSMTSKKKTEAAGLNARGGIDGTGKKAGRHKKYNYTKGEKGLMGALQNRECTIPDEIAVKPKAHLDKSFPVRYTGADGNVKRTYVVIVSCKVKPIILKQVPS